MAEPSGLNENFRKTRKRSADDDIDEEFNSYKFKNNDVVVPLNPLPPVPGCSKTRITSKLRKASGQCWNADAFSANPFSVTSDDTIDSKHKFLGVFYDTRSALWENENCSQLEDETSSSSHDNFGNDEIEIVYESTNERETSQPEDVSLVEYPNNIEETGNQANAIPRHQGEANSLQTQAGIIGSQSPSGLSTSSSHLEEIMAKVLPVETDVQRVMRDPMLEMPEAARSFLQGLIQDHGFQQVFKSVIVNYAIGYMRSTGSQNCPDITQLVEQLSSDNERLTFARVSAAFMTDFVNFHNKNGDNQTGTSEPSGSNQGNDLIRPGRPNTHDQINDVPDTKCPETDAGTPAITLPANQSIFVDDNIWEEANDKKYNVKSPADAINGVGRKLFEHVFTRDEIINCRLTTRLSGDGKHPIFPANKMRFINQGIAWLLISNPQIRTQAAFDKYKLENNPRLNDADTKTMELKVFTNFACTLRKKYRAGVQ